MKTTNQRSEASAPANVRPSESKSGRAPLPKLDFKLRQRNRALPTQKLLQLLQREAPEFQRIARIVGQWVWIEFGQKQPPQITSALSQFGFHWNRRRQTWQHPCGMFAPFAPNPGEPRAKYGSRAAADFQPA